MIQKRAWILSLITMIFACGARAASVHVPDGTPVPLRLKAELSSSRTEIGQRVDFAVAHAVSVGGVVAIPEGSVAWGAVQSVKRDKEIKFDIVGLRLPNLREIKLRSVRQKTSNPGKDQIKLETRLGDTVGAAVGTGFTAYVDEDVQVEAMGASAAMPAALSAASRPAEVKPAAQAPVQAVAAPVTSAPTAPPPQVAPRQSNPTPTVTPATRPSASSSAAVPAVQKTPPPAPAPRVTPTTQTAAPAAQETVEVVDRVTVECFSDPTGAEIVINDEYYGNTPSILKLLPGTQRVDLKMPGYKTYSQTLDLTQGGAFQRVRGPLEKKE